MTDFALQRGTGAPTRARWALLAGGFLLASTGCGSGGRAPAADTYPQPTASADSARAQTINRRIAAAAARDSADRTARTQEVEYRIGPNDRVGINVFGAEAFSGEYLVEESGAIAVPLLGSVTAAGKTARELEADLEGRLGDTYMRDPHVAVQVLEMQSHGVSVVGAVGAPGVYQISRPSTLLEVLAMAQGLTETAGSTVYVLRPTGPSHLRPQQAMATDLEADPAAFADQEVIEVDLGALLESGAVEENVLVQAGDIVQVRQAGLVYVVGEVNRPGGFTIPPGHPMTVLQALALAEGLGSTAAADRGVIVREGADGGRQEIPVDLEKVLEGEEAPPMLAARDVLFVPNNTSKSFALGVVNALVSMVTFRGLVY